MRIEVVNAIEWAQMSEDAHRIVFDRHKPATWDRIDYAILLIDDSHDVAAGYITCREIDGETLYWQFGGAFPGTKGTIKSFQLYQFALNWCQGRYKRVTTLIENTNTVMLKMAMKVGFRVIGVRSFKGAILLEHLIDFEEKGGTELCGHS